MSEYYDLGPQSCPIITTNGAARTWFDRSRNSGRARPLPALAGSLKAVRAISAAWPPPPWGEERGGVKLPA